MALRLPEPIGPTVRLTEILHIPVDKYPNYNFIGRILGHRGSNLKSLEQTTQCKIKIRDINSKDQNQETSKRRVRRTPDERPVPFIKIIADDTRNRAAVKLAAAKFKIEKLLVPGEKPVDLQSWITPKSSVGHADKIIPSNVEHHSHN